MTENLGELPLAEADRLARERIEHHRREMSVWRRARAERLAAERAAGRSVVDIAEELGVHVQTVYEVLRAAKD
jgi:predicted transcriptional regulator